MSYLILIRHSEAEVSASASTSEWPLSPKGRDLCVALADAIKTYEPHLIVSSPMRRASETAQLTAERLGVPWRTESGVEEHRRPFLHRTDAELQATIRLFFESPAERVFGKESADECRDRFRAALDEIVRAEAEANVAIVSHRTILSAYAAPFFDLEPFELWTRLESPSFMVLDASSGSGLHIHESP